MKVRPAGRAGDPFPVHFDAIPVFPGPGRPAAVPSAALATMVRRDGDSRLLLGSVARTLRVRVARSLYEALAAVARG